METTVGAVKSGPEPVVKLGLKLTGLPTMSRTPLSVMVSGVLAGSGALGTNSTRVSAELRKKVPARGVAPLRTWKVVLLTLTGSTGLLMTTPGVALTATNVSPLNGTALRMTGSVESRPCHG